MTDANLSSSASHLRDPQGMLLTREQRAHRAVALLWMAFVLALLDAGRELHALPGDFYGIAELQLGRNTLA